jgi:uncharacterized repeat protein (TIGR02543 family)
MTTDLNVTADFEEVPPPPQYSLTVNTVGSGTVALAPPGGIYDELTEVTLTPNPLTGWSFTGWSGDVSSTDNPLVVTMTTDLNVTATFEEVPPPPQYTITVNTVGSGAVGLNPPGGTYDESTVVTLTATPSTGWAFTGWSGDLSSTDNPLGVVMSADWNVTATFEETGLSNVPSFVSFVPGSGSSAVGSSRAFQLTVGDGNGYQDITLCRVEIRPASGAATNENTVIIEYSGVYGKIYMYNHTTGRFKGGIPGSTVVVEDNLCLFDVSQTAVEGNGGYLTVDFSLMPKVAFSGDKTIWVQLVDASGNKLRYLQIGSWTVLGQ